jgi:5-methylcytosine-specific restriction endonuclease McrA
VAELPTTDPGIQLLLSTQGLLRDSRFTTSYKFDVLRVLCDLSIELSPRVSHIPLQAVAERFVRLYWRQALPLQVPAAGEVRGAAHFKLGQGGSAAKPARVLTLVRRWQSAEDPRAIARGPDTRLVEYSRAAISLLKRDVLHRLQPADRQFLYRWPGDGKSLEMVLGVLGAMRSLHGVLCDLIESHWVRWVEARNPGLPGSSALRDHLFGGRRADVQGVIEGLLDLQQGRSFYSRTSISRGALHVDHFIPWSLSRHDAVGNLVLCTPAENLKWSDLLKPQALRDKLQVRNEQFAEQLMQIASEARLRWDPAATSEVSDWAYGTARAG